MIDDLNKNLSTKIPSNYKISTAFLLFGINVLLYTGRPVFNTRYYLGQLKIKLLPYDFTIILEKIINMTKVIYF